MHIKICKSYQYEYLYIYFDDQFELTYGQFENTLYHFE